MGWVSLLEDNLEKIQDSIRLAEKSLKNKNEFSDLHRQESLKALNDAHTIFVRAWEHLELATAPELDLAHENKELSAKIRSLEHKLSVEQSAAEELKREAAEQLTKLQRAIQEKKEIQKKYRNLEKKFEKVAAEDFGSAVDAFSSEGMIKKYKPNV